MDGQIYVLFGSATELLIMPHEQAHVNQKQMACLLTIPAKEVTFAPVSSADICGTQNERGHTQASSHHQVGPTDPPLPSPPPH